MPHDGTGAGWDETLPTDSGLISDTGQEIRDLRIGVRIRLEKEHNPLDVDEAGGEHKPGSACAYYQGSFPSQRPNGTSDLSSADNGRLLVYTADSSLWFWDGTAWQRVVVSNVAGIADGILTKDKCASGFTAGIYPYAIIVDEKADGTDGGDFTNGAWRTRTLNTERSDTGAIVSVASNQFTLAAGTYRIKAKAPAYKVDQHQCRIRNITDGNTTAYGTTSAAGASDSVVTFSEVETVVTITGSTVFELQHRCTTTNTGDGFGIAGSFGGVEVYSVVEIYKLL